MKILDIIGRLFQDDVAYDAKIREMIAHPLRTIERAKSHLHKPIPDLSTARALKLLDDAWLMVKVTQERGGLR